MTEEQGFAKLLSMIWEWGIDLAKWGGFRLLAGVSATALAYGTVQWIFKPAGKKLRGTTDEVYLRLSAVLVGMGSLMIFHGAAPVQGPLSFGPGPLGWCQAALFGFFAGAFAGRLHDIIKRRFSGKTGGDHG